MNELILESCHSTWVFEADRKRFCRVLKGIEVAERAVSTEWRAYSSLEIDLTSEEFTIYLNEERDAVSSVRGGTRAIARNVGATRPPNCPWRRSTTPFEPEPRGNQWALQMNVAHGELGPPTRPHARHEKSLVAARASYVQG